MENILSISDEELVCRAQTGDIASEEALMRKYKGAVKKKAYMYSMAGGDEDDIMQEGMIGLLKAIRKYETGKDASFATFASVCIGNQIITAIRSADRDKHKPLNTSVSLSNPVKPESEDNTTIGDILRTGNEHDPETMLIFKDILYYILNNDDKILSDFEVQVVSEALKDRDCDNIAVRLGKSTKSVNNAMQRAKRKIVEYLGC